MVKTALTTTKATLPNGLTVLLKEMHAAPVTTLNVWYRVGSRNEHLGITGISHWVEHMMFKGTPRYNEAQMDRLVSREGGQRNAFTWVDFTCYYETMPAHKIDLAIEIEADRMVNTQFRKREVESEPPPPEDARAAGHGNEMFVFPQTKSPVQVVQHGQAPQLEPSGRPRPRCR